MRSTTRLFLLPLAAIALMVAACSGGDSGDDLTGTTWQWVSMEESVPAGLSNVPDPENYTITFNEDGSYEGKADCNQIAGQYTTGSGGEISILAGPSTLMACPEGSADFIFTGGLAAATSYRIDGGQLVLVNDNGSMTFDAAS
jgi:heat shock protein HslJ